MTNSLSPPEPISMVAGSVVTNSSWTCFTEQIIVAGMNTASSLVRPVTTNSWVIPLGAATGEDAEKLRSEARVPPLSAKVLIGVW